MSFGGGFQQRQQPNRIVFGSSGQSTTSYTFGGGSNNRNGNYTSGNDRHSYNQRGNNHNDVGNTYNSNDHRSSRPREVCRNFLRGYCRFGDNCRFSHDIGSTSTSRQQQNDRNRTNNCNNYNNAPNHSFSRGGDGDGRQGQHRYDHNEEDMNMEDERLEGNGSSIMFGRAAGKKFHHSNNTFDLNKNEMRERDLPGSSSMSGTGAFSFGAANIGGGGDSRSAVEHGSNAFGRSRNAFGQTNFIGNAQDGSAMNAFGSLQNSEPKSGQQNLGGFNVPSPFSSKRQSSSGQLSFGSTSSTMMTNHHSQAFQQAQMSFGRGANNSDSFGANTFRQNDLVSQPLSQSLQSEGMTHASPINSTDATESEKLVDSTNKYQLEWNADVFSFRKIPEEAPPASYCF